MIYVYFIIKEAVCEYRLFFYLYYRLQRDFRVLRVIRGFFLGSLKARCFVVTQHSESRVSHSVFATPKHLADRQLKI